MLYHPSPLTHPGRKCIDNCILRNTCNNGPSAVLGFNVGLGIRTSVVTVVWQVVDLLSHLLLLTTTRIWSQAVVSSREVAIFDGKERWQFRFKKATFFIYFFGHSFVCDGTGYNASLLVRVVTWREAEGTQLCYAERELLATQSRDFNAEKNAVNLYQTNQINALFCPPRPHSFWFLSNYKRTGQRESCNCNLFQVWIKRICVLWNPTRKKCNSNWLGAASCQLDWRLDYKPRLMKAPQLYRVRDGVQEHLCEVLQGR